MGDSLERGESNEDSLLSSSETKRKRSNRNKEKGENELDGRGGGRRGGG
jgi:hypothetical protein